MGLGTKTGSPPYTRRELAELRTVVDAYRGLMSAAEALYDDTLSRLARASRYEHAPEGGWPDHELTLRAAAATATATLDNAKDAGGIVFAQLAEELDAVRRRLDIEAARL